VVTVRHRGQDASVTRISSALSTNGARVALVATVVSAVAATVAATLSTVAGVPEQVLVIATILVATEAGWRVADRTNP
jgi:hypothetical protein